MKRAMFTSAVALIASVALTDSSMADTLGPDFTFSYATSYGSNGLSQPYSATTSTGGSYGTGVAVQSSDPSQKTYSLVEANANIGVGGCKACVPVQGRTIASSSTTPSYLGEYSIVRRTSSGNIDKAFGDKGYVTAFPMSTDESYRFTSLCIDPGTSKIVLVGQQTTTSGTVGVIERLNPPATGSGTATLDTTFNASGPTPGVVTVSTPDGLDDPALYNCAVVDEGAGHNGTIVASGIDDSSAASLVLAVKITGNGTPAAGFGTNGVVEYPVDSVNGSGTAASLTNITVTGGGAKDDFSDIILSGFSYAKGLKQTGKATGLTVAIKDSSGDLDTAFNGTGELVNADYGDAILARVVTTRDGTASDLDIVYGTVGTAASAFVDYTISGGVVDLANPEDTQTGILSGPADFAATQGYTTNKKGQLIVSGNTTSGGQQLITIDASRALGY